MPSDPSASEAIATTTSEEDNTHIDLIILCTYQC